jgi:hypothetical protein
MSDIKVFSGGVRAEVAAGQMCQEIKKAVYSFAGRVPLATAIGVLDIAKHEILQEQNDA